MNPQTDKTSPVAQENDRNPESPSQVFNGEDYANVSFSPGSKYKRYPAVQLENRQWPNRITTEAPIWCDVSLRDGNQSIENPMSITQKIEMYELLIRLGFKEIEIGFPSSSPTEFEFTRKLIEENRIPSHVTPQVLVPAIPERIEQTFQALEGCPRVIVHLYNTTSELQREVVYKKSQDEILKTAVDGTLLIKKFAEEAEKNGTKVTFQYSPESFTGTELEFARRVVDAVSAAWNPSPDRKMIVNLPATEERTTPNIYADQIEWMSTNIARRPSIIISAHTHNDQGTGVAAAELAMLAGAERVEVTVDGNGERNGNCCGITMAANLYSQGIDPKINLSLIPEVLETFPRLTGIPIHPRQPYLGEYTFTAFSGTHQNAIKAGMDDWKNTKTGEWKVPYIPVDPDDFGLAYRPKVRINAQSGKGGVAFILSDQFSCDMPKAMHTEFGNIVKLATDRMGREAKPHEIWDIFEAAYLRADSPVRYMGFLSAPIEQNPKIVECILEAEIGGKLVQIAGKGNGPLDACRHAIEYETGEKFNICRFSEHSRTGGSDATAIAYVAVTSAEGETFWGVGMHKSVEQAPVMALISAFNRMHAAKEVQETSVPAIRGEMPAAVAGAMAHA